MGAVLNSESGLIVFRVFIATVLCLPEANAASPSAVFGEQCPVLTLPSRGR